MKNTTKYLNQRCPNDELIVDRLIISAFIYLNELEVKNNHFLLTYLISKSDNDYVILQDFLIQIKQEKEKIDFEDLVELFEFVISPSDKIINGAIYTPLPIREYIVDNLLNKYNATQINNIICADIACGCGGFLFTLAKKIKEKSNSTYHSIIQNQIFGIDIQTYSVIRTKLLLSLLAVYDGEDISEFNFNIFEGDSLTFNWNNYINQFIGFDIIAGNPPYVSAKNLPEDVRENIKLWSVSRSGSPDLYIPFFQIGLENIKANGVLGFITMNTFFKSLNGRELRKYFSNGSYRFKIVDFGTNQIFKSKNTYTCICLIEKSNSDFIHYFKSYDKKLPESDAEYSRVYYKHINSFKGWNLHNNRTIEHIESVGKPLGSIFTTRHGIATLRNDVYIFKPVAEDELYYYLKSDKIYPIEKSICRDIINSNKLSRKISIDDLREKIIFPYNYTSKPKLLKEEDFKTSYPLAYQYLCNKKNLLENRDKGKGNYENWFAFGRTQSLENIPNKLFFPKFSDRIPQFLLNMDENLLFYNGQAVIGHNKEEMLLIKKIMETRLFWYYITSTSKPYNSEYFSLNGNYIKNFGIYDFSEEQKNYILKENNKSKLDSFFEFLYDIKI